MQGKRTALAAVVGALALAGCATELPSRNAVACSPADGDANPDGPVFRVERSKTGCNLGGYAIAIRGEGRFRNLYEETDFASAADAIDPVIERLRGDVEAHFEIQKTQNTEDRPLKILLYAHGGMVAKSTALAQAEKLAPAMLRDGYSPIFLVWESAFVSAYGRHLCCVRDGLEDNRYPYLWAPARLVGDLASSVGRAPQTFGSQLLRYGESIVGIKNTEYEIQADEAAIACGKLNGGACPRLVVPTGSEFDRNGDKNDARLRSVASAPLFPIRNTISMFGPEIGASAWDNMVRRTRSAFQRSALVDPPANGSCDIPEDQEEAAGFAIFFERLACEIVVGDDGVARFKLASGERVPVEIHFYGHSMGTLIGNEALATQPQLPWRDVVYMAAATTIRDFRSTAAGVIAANDKIAFRNLMLHPLAEARESFGLGVAPHGSLLEWIDEMFERPRSADERMLGKWSNAKRAMHILPDALRERSTFRVFPEQRERLGPECAPPAGGRKQKRCHPTVHGEFDDYSFWRPAFWTGAAPSALTPPQTGSDS